MSTPKVKVLDKALEILSHFYSYDVLSVKDIEEITRYNSTTIFRILRSFVEWGYLQQDIITKKYSLSIKIVEMAGTLLKKMNLIHICLLYYNSHD